MVKTHRTHRDVDSVTQGRIDAIAGDVDLRPPPVPRRPALSGCATTRRKPSGNAGRSFWARRATRARVPEYPVEFLWRISRPRPERRGSPSAGQKLAAVTKFINSFEYNHTGANYYASNPASLPFRSGSRSAGPRVLRLGAGTSPQVMKRDRGLKHVMYTAKEIMREALPIQCVEAVFLGIHLTAEIEELERIPVSFKSKVDGSSYRHIVLAVRDREATTWGALGISRRRTLQHKECVYPSLSALVEEFKDSYERCDHALVKVYAGLPLPPGLHSSDPVKWRVLNQGR